MTVGGAGIFCANGKAPAAGADDYSLYTYNRANQIEDATLYTSLPAWDGHQPVDVDYTANGLNQYTVVANKTYTYDANGNLIADGTDSFTYDAANRPSTRS